MSIKGSAGTSGCVGIEIPATTNTTMKCDLKINAVTPNDCGKFTDCYYCQTTHKVKEPILKKAPPHGFDYKPLTFRAFLRLCKASQKVADGFECSVYLVGSAVNVAVPRDIDVSVIMPLERYERLFGDLPIKQEGYNFYFGYVFRQSFEKTKPLHFCLPYYHLDVKVCPDTWWTEKPKMLLAEPLKHKNVFKRLMQFRTLHSKCRVRKETE